MCERSYPDYVNFSKTFSFGDISIVRKAIDDIRNCIIEDVISVDEITADANNLEVNMPDTEDFATNLAADALDASCTVYYCLQLLLSDNDEFITYISRYGTDKVDRYITEASGLEVVTTEFEVEILNHPLMKSEMQKQNEIISYVSASQFIKESDLDNWLIRIMQ